VRGQHGVEGCLEMLVKLLASVEMRDQGWGGKWTCGRMVTLHALVARYWRSGGCSGLETTRVDDALRCSLVRAQEV